MVFHLRLLQSLGSVKVDMEAVRPLLRQIDCPLGGGAVEIVWPYLIFNINIVS